MAPSDIAAMPWWQVFAAILAVWAVYFLPWLIAILRGRANGCAIGVVNIFLGWTLVGWVVALAWAVADDGGKR